MNDDFLHRLRKAPPPEFLTGLKTRLDRLPLPAAPPRRRHFTFSRGMLVGFLLGGAAFALALTVVPGLATSLLRLLQTPGQFVTRLWLRDSGMKDSGPPKVVPLGPVWLPEHPGGPSAPDVATVPAGLDAHAGDSARAGNVTNGNRPGVNNPAFNSVLVIAAPRALERATFAAQHCCNGYVKVELDKSGTPFERMCVATNPLTNSPTVPAAIVLSRRMTAEEERSCTQNIARPVMLKPFELKVGYQAIVLGRAKLYGPLRLTRRDLFLALAKHIPDPAHSGDFIDNPNTTWSQIDPGMPYERDRIQVIGPAPDSAAGRLAARLMLEAGCNTYPWIAALRERNPERYEEICTTLRDDGVYKRAGLSGWAYADELLGSPTTIGVFSPDEFASVKDTLSAVPLDGIEPSQASFASGDYAASLALYIYTNRVRFVYSSNILTFVRTNMQPANIYPGDPNAWGFVALDSTEGTVTQAALKELIN